ncbi:MAG: PQQ-binding-like beta-propeller repeat protein [Holosporaceae bacterium]|jgi:outer membrane protein assembly factor BamB|nr:PQQ-binding-like beta-propeller repeat protein [Holosporaceae bacterium]
MMTVKKTGVYLGCAGLLLVGCSSKVSLKGKREELIVAEVDSDRIHDKDSTPVEIDSGEERNNEYVQPYFSPSHCYLPLVFSPTPTEQWRSKLDFEATNEIRMTAGPVVAEEKVFCMDAAGIIYALDQKTGKRLWRMSTTLVGKNGQIGGALAYSNGILIVTSSFAEGFGLDATNGKIRWRIKLPAACKGDGLTISNGKAFALCGNSSLHCLDINSGKILWSHVGMIPEASFIGSASVAIDNNIVYCIYPSGEIFSLLEETGSVIWEAMLSKFSLTNAACSFLHPRACPVVKNGVLYTVSANAQTSAFDIRSGKRLWKNDFGGVQTPIVSGNSIFVFNSNSEVVCLNKDTGKKRWGKRFIKNSKDIFDWCSMVLLKDHLLIVSPSGDLIYLSVYDGSIKGTQKIDGSGSGISVNPAIANSVLYLLLNNGSVVAYK